MGLVGKSWDRSEPDGTNYRESNNVKQTNNDMVGKFVGLFNVGQPRIHRQIEAIFHHKGLFEGLESCNESTKGLRLTLSPRVQHRPPRFYH